LRVPGGKRKGYERPGNSLWRAGGGHRVRGKNYKGQLRSEKESGEASKMPPAFIFLEEKKSLGGNTLTKKPHKVSQNRESGLGKKPGGRSEGKVAAKSPTETRGQSGGGV